MNDSMQPPIWSDTPSMQPPPVSPQRADTGKKTNQWWSRSGWKWFWRVLLAITIVLVIGCGLLLHRFYDFGAAISTQSPFSSQLSGSGQVSLVFLGYGGPGHDGPYLTDSLLVVSYNPATGKSALISVPRDLWVQIPADSGNYAKLNTAYSYGVNNGGRDAGGTLAAQKITGILGMNVPYWVSLDFTGFEQLVDKLGGVDINVPDTFNGSLSPYLNPYTTFNAGEQHMDGAHALLFARARYCTPAAESSDFARSARQQILIKALAAKMGSPSQWPAVPGVMDALQTRLASNLSVRDLFSIFRNVDFANAKHIGLTVENVLRYGTSDDGQSILLPENGDWGAIQQYVQQQMNQ
jgi:polyisoprenyl-teichoic acid--peptidoglycan teichoic acid transferase